MRFPLSWLLFNKWLWITISSVTFITIGPFITIALILTLPQELKGIATLMLIISSGIAAGYKDWVVARRKEETKIKLPTSESHHG